MNTSQPCHPRLISMVPSSRCEVRLTVCERSATQKCINLPNSFPRVRDMEDRRGTNHRRRQKFLHPRSSASRSPLPMPTFWGPCHTYLFQMIANQTDHGQLRPDGDTGLGRNDDSASNRPINCLISIVRPHSESRSVPMNRLMSWWNTIDSIPFQ
jgi:hypothetical protein